ncbi:OLC1v1038053C1 [Oldenlandia corymbosa var. corymbosa]|uniref:OLC1v1038053C1 n=1 Tax=Oldenlandia corymbosa var. corymbosa TaxID=529605 RepID=A0AAV1D026_OLDCO|nr:OLC1v1038053C1 [Oldenlandia corymbosa var. corymbosa]
MSPEPRKGNVFGVFFSTKSASVSVGAVSDAMDWHFWSGSRLGSIGISLGLFKLGYFKRNMIAKDSSFRKLYRCASSALDLVDSDSGSSSDFYSADELVGFENIKFHGFERLPLFSIVVIVVKSLNWRVANTIRFEDAVDKYGFPGCIYAFRMIVHLFAFAGMRLEVHALLRDILCYYQKVDLDLSELLPTIVESCNHEATLVFVVDALIMVFASNLLLENAVNVFFQAKGIGIQPGIRACNFLLKCLSERNKSNHLLTLFQEMEVSGPPPCVYTYTILINYWCNEGYAEGKEGIEKASSSPGIKKSASLFEKMTRVGISPSVVTYSVYIRGLCRAGRTTLALNVIKDLRHNKPLNAYCYNAVMHSFCKNGEPEEAMEVFAEMKRCGILPDVHSYTILIHGYCKFGNVEKGLTLFEEMDRDTNIKPSLITYSSLLDGLCKSGLMEASVDMFRELRNCGYKYDQHAYNILISSFLRQGNTDCVHEPEEMIRNNLDDSLTGDVASVCYIEGHVRKALEFLEEMHNQGINPNSFSYGIIIDKLCKEGKPEKALELIPYMLRRKVLPNVVVYSTLIHGFSRQGQVKKALLVYSSMIKFGVTPNKVTYTILINLLFTMGKDKEAYYLFGQMILNRLNPDKVSYTSIIAGLCKTGHLNIALQVYREMQHQGHLPSVVTYTCLIDAYCKQGRMDIATMLVDEMRRKNLSPDVVTYTVLVRAYLRQGQVETVHYLFKEMRKEGLVPDDIMCNLLGLSKEH